MNAAITSSPRSGHSPHDSLAAAVERLAGGDVPVLTFHDSKEEPVRVSTGALFTAARRWAALFRRHGVTRGERVVILLPTGEAFASALLGAALCGAAPVPLATPMTFGGAAPFLRNLMAILDDARPAVVVTIPRFLEPMRAAAPSFDLRVLTPKDRDDLSEQDLRAALAVTRSISGDDIALIQYTSGTTGAPKGVVISHRALVANAFAIADGLALCSSDVGVSWLPLFHDMGLVGVLLTGVCHPYPVHIAAPMYFALGAQRWMELAAQVGATVSSAPNFAYEMATARTDRLAAPDLSALRCMLNGAEPVQPSTIRRFESAHACFGLRPRVVMPVYGMAECTLAVTFPVPGAPLRVARVDRAALEHGEIETPRDDGKALELACVGRPVAGLSLAITDASGRHLAARKFGNIRVKGSSVMSGYFRNDQASSATLGADGWLDTGDRGFIEDGQLYVTGRAKDVIIQAGRNVYPYDIERVAVEAARVRPGAVVALGRRNEATGTEEIVLIAESSVRAAERVTTARRLQGEILAVLGVRVDEVQLWPIGAVPKTTSGKARRRECASLLAARSHG